MAYRVGARWSFGFLISSLAMKSEFEGVADPVSIEAVDFRLSGAFRSELAAKAGSLFRRHADLLGVKLRLRREETGRAVSEYCATARLVLPGYDRIVVKRGDELGSLLSEVWEVSARHLRRRARLSRVVKRSRPA